MDLTSFIKDLLENGNVTVSGTPIHFEENDRQESALLLKAYYNEDILDIALTPPEFSVEAALWGAEYCYNSIQMMMQRTVEDNMLSHYLKPFEGSYDASTIYSADLFLRYLPDLLQTAKGLAPDDRLVSYVTETACQWPFSTASEELAHDEGRIGMILNHASLRIAYADRIIRSRNKKLAGREEIKEIITEALGDHANLIWPEFKNI